MLPSPLTGALSAEARVLYSDIQPDGINRVQIDLEKDDHDHLISPDGRFRLAMARQ
jgi:hypothetical protein